MKKPRFKPRKVEGRKNPWMIPVPVALRDKGWKLRYFPTRESAVRYADQLSRAWNEQQIAGNLSDLLPTGVTMTDVVKDYINRHGGRPRPKVTLAEAWDAFIAAKKSRRPRTHETYRQARNLFVRELGAKRQVATINVHNIQRVLDPLPFNTARLRKASMRAMLNWAAAPSRGWVEGNAAEGCDIGEAPIRHISILTVGQATTLLRYADELTLFYAIGLFAGGRPSEIQRLEWRDIDLEAGTIRFTATKSRRVSRQRFVPLSDNLRGWIEQCGDRSRKIVPLSLGRRHRRIFEQVRKSSAWASLETWPQDCCRHSFASYWLAHHHDQGRLQYLMGHRSGDMIHDHYLAAVPEKEAEAYWSISAG